MQRSPMRQLPPWADTLIVGYEAEKCNQFILHGNVNDRMVLPLDDGSQLGSLQDFLLQVMMPRFDVVLTYDLGNGVRVEKGGAIIEKWPRFSEKTPKKPREAIDFLTHFFRYCGNLKRLGSRNLQVGCILYSIHLVAPGGYTYDINALASLIRDWSAETLLTESNLATFLVTENLNDLNPLLVNNSRAEKICVPLPSPQDLEAAFEVMAPSYPTALAGYRKDLASAARQLAGASLSAVEGLLKVREHTREELAANDLTELKKGLVEDDCNGLIEFIESDLTLDNIHGNDAIKEWLRQDVTLWERNELAAMPMGYLLCGPVGTGKTFMVKCLAGEAGVPVVRFKNFRDKWVGSTEGNLETIFRLLHALGRCFVFVDEADQALGKRGGGNSDSGLSGRIYSMLAEEMSDTRNRGKILWILASSRPDLIEVDLKRPGRIDVKIPLFPATTPEEGFHLIKALSARRGIELDDSLLEKYRSNIPELLTPGAAEALAVKLFRIVRTSDVTPEEALVECITGYRNPVPEEIMDFQIGLAVKEASDPDFIPEMFREM